MKIATDFCDGLGEGLTHGNLGNALHLMDEFWKAMEYHKKHLDIALKVGDRNVEGGAYGNLDNDSNSPDGFQKAVECQGKHSNIANEM